MKSLEEVGVMECLEPEKQAPRAGESRIDTWRWQLLLVLQERAEVGGGARGKSEQCGLNLHFSLDKKQRQAARLQ